MSQFLTLKRSDPLFHSHVTGRFAADRRAIPVNVGVPGADQAFTFEIRKLEDVDRPNIVLTLLRLVRWPLLTLTVMPAIFTGVVTRPAVENFPAYQYLLALLSLIFFHSSLFAWNDYRDHVRGWDLQYEKAGSRTIQRGYLAAYQVKLLAWSWLILAIGFAAPLVFEKWQLLGFALCAFTFAASVELFRKIPQLKIFMNHVTIFFCFGPLLVYGAAYFFLGARLENHNIIFTFVSVLFGLAAVIYMQARQFGNLMSDHQARAVTVAVHLGFDKMKHLLMVELLLLAFVIVAFLMAFRFSIWGWLTAAPLLIWLICLTLFTKKCESPLSSRLARLPSYYLGTHWLLSIWLVVEALL